MFIKAIRRERLVCSASRLALDVFDAINIARFRETDRVRGEWGGGSDGCRGPWGGDFPGKNSTSGRAGSRRIIKRNRRRSGAVTSSDCRTRDRRRRRRRRAGGGHRRFSRFQSVINQTVVISTPPCDIRIHRVVSMAQPPSARSRGVPSGAPTGSNFDYARRSPCARPCGLPLRTVIRPDGTAFAVKSHPEGWWFVDDSPCVHLRIQ